MKARRGGEAWKAMKASAKRKEEMQQRINALATWFNVERARTTRRSHE